MGNNSKIDIDFTQFRHPVLAVSCPSCKQKVGSMCVRPSEHNAADFHAERKQLADKRFIEIHGESASIEKTENGWLINPNGYISKTKQLNLSL